MDSVRLLSEDFVIAQRAHERSSQCSAGPESSPEDGGLLFYGQTFLSRCR
jgi:hypothetical protein